MPTKLSITIEDEDKRWKALVKRVKEASGQEVAFGVFKGEIAEYAIINEFGASGARIKPRPFLTRAVDAGREKYFNIIAKAYAKVLDGGGSNWKQVLNRVGIEGRNDTVRSILDGEWEPNAPSTVETKGSSRPLVDTGALMNAITWAVGKIGSFDE